MPPKKQPDKKKEPEEEPVGYNVSIMTLDQLKQYAKLLQNEIEDMRRHCSFYQKMEDELVELLSVTEDNLRNTEDNILSKDIELERLKLKFLKHLQEKRQRSECMEQTSSIRKDHLSSDTCNRLEKEQERYMKETERLKEVLDEKDRHLDSLRVKIEMARRETNEINESYLTEMEQQQDKLLEEAVNRFEKIAEETQEDFKEALETIKLEAQEDKMQSERTFNATCETFKQKLHDYYKEVTKQDLDAIKKLKNEIKKMEQNISSSKHQLKQALNENEKLKGASRSKIKNRVNWNAASKYDACPLKVVEALKAHKRTEKLVLANQDLEEQIKSVMERTQNLRRQFTGALGKARDNAEMKAGFLEKKLSFILEENQNESPTTLETELENETDNETETSGSTVTESEASEN